MGRKSDAREKLIEAARTLMWERGYVDVGVGELCERAGVRPGSFYYFFPSKSALTAEALEAQWQLTRTLVLEPAAEVANPLERLQRYLALTQQGHATMRAEAGHACGCPFGNLSGELAALDPELQAKLRDIFERQYDFLEETLRDAHAQGLVDIDDPRRAAKMVVAYVQGVQTLAHLHDDPCLIENLMPEIERLLAAQAA